MKNSFSSSIDSLFTSLEKAGGFKYIKRIPHPRPKPGRKYIYFYNQQQIKDYKTKGIIPGEKPAKKEEEKKKPSMLSGIMKFFGFDNQADAAKKGFELYDNNKSELGNIGKADFTMHLDEYLANKEKWDLKLAPKEKKEPEEKAEPEAKEPKEKVETAPKERKKSEWNLGLMRKIAGIVSGSVKEKEGKEALQNMLDKDKKTVNYISDRAEFIEKKLKESFGQKIKYVPEMDERYSVDRKKVIDNAKKEFKEKFEATETKKPTPLKESAEKLEEKVSEGKFKDIDIDLNKMKSIRVPKEIKEKGMGSKEYKEWVKENWAKDKPKEPEKPASKETGEGPYSDKMLKNKKGEYKKSISHGSLNFKNIKDPLEKKAFNELKAKNMAGGLEDTRTQFNFHPDAIKEGVWTDGRILIHDKEVTDEIYNKNKANRYLQAKRYTPDMSDSDIVTMINQEGERDKFPDWRRVVPDKEDLSKEESKFTGRVDNLGAKAINKYVEYEDSTHGKTYYNGNYMATLKSMFPNATFHSGGEFKPGALIENGKIKAVIMATRKPMESALKTLEKATLKSSINSLFSSLEKAKGKTEAQKKFEYVMSEFKAGKLKSSSGKIVTDRKQAIAIAMSESGQSENMIEDKKPLEKAKEMPVGAVSKSGKYKKTADGKWVRIKKDKPETKPQSKPEKKTEKKPETKEKDQKLDEQKKGIIKNALKKMANILADALSGRETVGQTAQAVEQTGQEIKQTGKIKPKNEQQQKA